MVPAGGLEPPRLATSDFESDVSTIPPRGHANYVDRILHLWCLNSVE